MSGKPSTTGETGTENGQRIYLHAVSSTSRYGDALYRATTADGQVVYEHISSSYEWGMSDLRGGLTRLGLIDGSELIEGTPPTAGSTE